MKRSHCYSTQAVYFPITARPEMFIFYNLSIIIRFYYLNYDTLYILFIHSYTECYELVPVMTYVIATDIFKKNFFTIKVNNNKTNTTCRITEKLQTNKLIN